MTQTPSVSLRRAEREDLDSFVMWMDDPELLGFIHGDRAQATRELRERIVAMLGQSMIPTMPGSGFFVIDAAERGPIGLATLKHVSWRNRSCRFDTYIRKEQESDNTVEMALRCTIEYCLDEMNLHRVSHLVPATDTRAAGIMEKLGAKREAVLRGHMVRDEQPVDVYWYGVLREEYQRNGA